MKKIILFLAVASLFGSACSSKIGIAKRKYGKGYYVSVSHQPKSSVKSQTNSRIAFGQNPKSIEDKNVVIMPSAPLVYSSVKKTESTENHPANSNKVHSKLDQTSVLASASTVEAERSASALRIQPLNKLQSVKANKSNSADDTNTILLVILCLFWWLNLIAVYLHAGKKINNDFWITLVLDILVIFGIIYSILVVLDVLSFA